MLLFFLVPKKKKQVVYIGSAKVDISNWQLGVWKDFVNQNNETRTYLAQFLYPKEMNFELIVKKSKMENNQQPRIL